MLGTVAWKEVLAQVLGNTEAARIVRAFLERLVVVAAAPECVLRCDQYPCVTTIFH